MANVNDKYAIRMMKADDYEQAFVLWNGLEGLGLSEADSPERITRFLQRNEGLSFVCEYEGSLIGTIMAGHDSRRGFLYHLGVATAHRGQGIAPLLVNEALSALLREGIDKCHLFVMEHNEAGQRFWSANGWEKRDGILLYSKGLDSKGPDSREPE
ncbi:GNAT family N-acetyltransferase [Paenibacillus kribbensis]|uniref:GNAT family N-acetyltransferase n=1 Tax=Paenibacillus kribbensis TaxID=172713 RepID=UPI002DB7B071|nr:GNAT family N-acetyltransferase [Paenibacillus kribbensis]MEC0237843.1 GNAT family N-acetyltransferase [Paenibacillus kribbensis]